MNRSLQALVAALMPPPALPAIAVLGLAVVLTLLPAVQVHAQDAGRPLRLGIHHSYPRLCLKDEPSQRDLRVLRRAFGVAEVPAQRLAPPWYLVPAPPPRKGQPVAGWALDTEALWGHASVALRGGQPDLPTDAPRDRLASWRDWVVARSGGALRPAAPGPALLEDAAGVHPFVFSRFSGSRALPFALHGLSPLDLCRDWPAGVRLEPAAPPLTYVLHGDRAPHAGRVGAYMLTGYRDPNALWRDYFRGRLDAVLLEGMDLDGHLSRYRASQLGAWGGVTGTQQLVLRLDPDLARRMGPQLRLALSQALSREALAEAAGAPEFVAAHGFFGPVRGTEAPGVVALAWNSLQARRQWLRLELALPELRLVLLDHPVLRRIAQRMQAQWSRTLNLGVRLMPVSFDQYERVLAGGQADLALDVRDLDDGSLQDLWRDTLELDGGAGVPGERTLARWEDRLAEALPYLPLLENRHWVLLRRDAPRGLLERVCPGCLPAGAPGRTAPEPDLTERPDPRG